MRMYGSVCNGRALGSRVLADAAPQGGGLSEADLTNACVCMDLFVTVVLLALVSLQMQHHKEAGSVKLT